MIQLLITVLLIAGTFYAINEEKKVGGVTYTRLKLDNNLPEKYRTIYHFKWLCFTALLCYWLYEIGERNSPIAILVCLIETVLFIFFVIHFVALFFIMIINFAGFLDRMEMMAQWKWIDMSNGLIDKRLDKQLSKVFPHHQFSRQDGVYSYIRLPLSGSLDGVDSESESKLYLHTYGENDYGYYFGGSFVKAEEELYVYAYDLSHKQSSVLFTFGASGVIKRKTDLDFVLASTLRYYLDYFIIDQEENKSIMDDPLQTNSSELMTQIHLHDKLYCVFIGLDSFKTAFANELFGKSGLCLLKEPSDRIRKLNQTVKFKKYISCIIEKAQNDQRQLHISFANLIYKYSYYDPLIKRTFNFEIGQYYSKMDKQKVAFLNFISDVQPTDSSMKRYIQKIGSIHKPIKLIKLSKNSYCVFNGFESFKNDLAHTLFGRHGLNYIKNPSRRLLKLNHTVQMEQIVKKIIVQIQDYDFLNSSFTYYPDFINIETTFTFQIGRYYNKPREQTIIVLNYKSSD